MPKICYERKKFNDKHLATIEAANEIIAEYKAQGYSLTLRQLYYQFVARDLLPNTLQNYKWLGGIINDGRMAGLIDWDAIEDRTRNLRSLGHWSSPGDIIVSAAQSFHYDHWHDQPVRVEVWIEKDALIGVVERACHKWDVPHFSCRGYTSASEVWGAAMRFVNHAQGGQHTHVLHFGDHDPSGIDMTRDIETRIATFMEASGCTPATIQRMALNMDQVRKYRPPSNPAKITDSRAVGYIREYGEKSWELDALEPRVLEKLIDKEIESLVNERLFNNTTHAEQGVRETLRKAADHWDDVSDFLETI